MENSVNVRGGICGVELEDNVSCTWLLLSDNSLDEHVTGQELLRRLYFVRLRVTNHIFSVNIVRLPTVRGIQSFSGFSFSTATFYCPSRFLLPNSLFNWLAARSQSYGFCASLLSSPSEFCVQPSRFAHLHLSLPLYYITLFRVYFVSLLNIFFNILVPTNTVLWPGMSWRLRRCATIRAVRGSIPSGVTGFFSDILLA